MGEEQKNEKWARSTGRMTRREKVVEEEDGEDEAEDREDWRENT